jgi:hypothetical protein
MNHPDYSEVQGVPIAQIEAAINVWRNRNPAISDDEVPVLCAQARCLAELYGTMIYARTITVPRATFTEAQLSALAGALA